MKEIVIDVFDTGEIKIETRGFQGKSCIVEAEFLKEVLGKETKRSLTPTYWQKNQAKIKKYLPLCG